MTQSTEPVEPRVYLAAATNADYSELYWYLEENVSPEASQWLRDRTGLTGSSNTANLIEFAGRMCYRSYAPGLNPNVTRVRTDQEAYFRNLLLSRHGSVLEHVSFSFVFANVSRVFTHELVRHRAGTAVSQESLRYMRLGSIPFWIPDWAQEDEDLMLMTRELLSSMEDYQRFCAEHFGLDKPGVPFHEKKGKTSFMRRLAPEGLATHITWTCNARALRHIIETRTAAGAEEEIRLVFDGVVQVMREAHPLLFGDYERQDDGSWTTEFPKV